MFGEGELSGFLQSHRQDGGTTGNEKEGWIIFFFIAKVLSECTLDFFSKLLALKKKKKTKDTKHTVIYMVHTPAEFCILDIA